MARKKKKLAAKYLVRRVVFVLLLLGLLALGGCGLWVLLTGGEEPEGSGSSSGQSRESQSSSQPEPTSAQPGGESEPREPDPGPASASDQTGGKPEPQEPAPAPEPEVVSGDQDDWRLVLINPTHAIEQELDIQLTEVNGYRFDSRVAGKVRELIAAAQSDGISLAIISGYRTMERSRVLYANKVAEYRAMGYDEASAKVEAAKWVAPPGTSEHHSGLAMDIVSSGYYNRYSDLVEAFENDPEAVWLRENCARFGFILRFPKDKTAITGINYEPWHFRYVGEEHAKKIMEQGLCLEEYLGETG